MRNTGDREYTHDFYETPAWATKKIVEALLRDQVISLSQAIYEPCSGAGAIHNVLRDAGFITKASDIQTAEYIAGEKGVDVWDIPDECCDVVMTNPPYNLMCRRDMLTQFLRIARDKVILLLNISFLAGERRNEALKRSGLKYVYISTKRVTMYPYGKAQDNSGTQTYAWYVFERGYTGDPSIRWV